MFTNTKKDVCEFTYQTAAHEESGERNTIWGTGRWSEDLSHTLQVLIFNKENIFMHDSGK